MQGPISQVYKQYQKDYELPNLNNIFYMHFSGIEGP